MYYIGVDLGGTNIAAGIVDENGMVLRKKSVPTLRERSHGEIIKDIAALCKNLIDETGHSGEIRAIGIGTPGSVDPANGIITYANNINFNNVKIREEMREYIDIPVFIDNDANCAALGEAKAGAAKGLKHSVTVTLGTGVGGGVIIDGKIFGGAFYGGAELGHHVVHIGGEQCTCGRRGCWEAYASASALIRNTQRVMAKEPDGVIAELVNSDEKLVTAKTPFDAADKGDEAAARIISEYLRNVAEGIANIINIFQPEVVVIGGGVCYQGERIRKPINEYVDLFVYGGNNRTSVVIAELGNDAGIVGAAMLCV